MENRGNSELGFFDYLFMPIYWLGNNLIGCACFFGCAVPLLLLGCGLTLMMIPFVKDQGDQAYAAITAKDATPTVATTPASTPVPGSNNTVAALNNQPAADMSGGSALPSQQGQVAQQEVPAANGTTGIVALGYDEQGRGLAAGQSTLAAIFVRQAQSGVWDAGSNEAAQNAMVAAIQAIQTQAAVANATRLEGAELTLPFQTTWLVWCSNASRVSTPADVAYPLKADHLGWGQIFIWSPASHYDLPPDPSLRSFSGCEGGVFWAVALQ
ncbi:MAG TPA: hypothetical protein VD999_04550 [Vitreimonas sp.]|nr:hypothetical protein [Vitreimonas sp.]